MDCLCWNCRGAGDAATEKEVKNLVSRNRPAVLCLLETQLEKSRMQKLARSFGYDNCYAVSSEGRSGGLAMYWNNPLVMDLQSFSKNHIDMKVTDGDNELWRLTCIYGEANRTLRYRTWNLMSLLCAHSDLPWVCIGDYNEVLRREEHFGVGDRDDAQINAFKQAVDVCNLADLGYLGLDWTFEKKVRGGTYTRVRLDRALANPRWMQLFPQAELRHLTAVKSDHCPILLIVQPRPIAPNARARQRSFKFEMMWETHPQFIAHVEKIWKDAGECATLDDMNSKLNSLSRDLLKWDKDVFGEVRKEIKILHARLAELREVPGRIGPSHEEIKICDKIVELNHREEIMWRQRSQIQWLAEGDSNTQFFHRKASGRKRKNQINKLCKADGSVTSDPAEMKEMARDFYHSLYTSEGTQGMHAVLNTVPNRVTGEMNDLLIAPYNEKEIKDALFQMFPTKAPGPDGFPAHFFQRYWDLCGKEVTRAVLNILNGVESPASINSTNMVLIPKVSNPESLSQFRPISLCNVVLKIVSKVQANRLKQILPDIISTEQSAFVPGRLITDIIISAYECLHFMKKKRGRHKQFGALKVDMMKAYDRVEWSYLEAIMLKLGIHEDFVRSVMRLVTTVSISVLFNGEGTDSFQPSRGIRQGDPISPYLFLIAAEGLSCLLRSRGTENLEGIIVAPQAPPVNHLLFADDSLLFFKANTGGAHEIDVVLNIYCLASGQRINRDKSSIHFSKGCPESVRQEVKNVLHVPNESLSEKYLGMPTVVGSNKNGTFKYVTDRIWKCIQGWIEQILSVGGKEVLIKSVAQAIPTFSMSCFKLPRGLCKKIDALLRNFWWGSKHGQRKPCWVSWDTMTMPKFMGGLGFRDTELFNLALLAKQAWRVITDPNSLSARILKAAYFPNSDLMQAELGNRPSQIWRALLEGRDALKLGLIKRIGDGASTRIWHDNWIPRDSRMLPFAAIRDDPPVMVSDLIDSSTGSWNIQKLEQNFLPMDIQAIKSIPVCTAPQEDFWAWNFEKTGLFTVRSAYRVLVHTRKVREDWLEGRQSSSSSASEQKLWCKMWKVKIPIKIRVFLWRLAHQSIPTGSVRHHRNMTTSPECCFCHASEDDWRHSLMDCAMARSVWALLDEDLVEHLTITQCSNAKEWIFSLIESLPHDQLVQTVVTLWAIWSARRKAIHEEIYQSPYAIVKFVEKFIEDLHMITVPPKTRAAVQPVRPRAPCWIAPTGDYVKFNVDAAVSRVENRGVVAAICRSHDGTYLGSSALACPGISDPATLESIACREALALADDLQITRCVIASDCLEVINSLKNNCLPRYASVLREIFIRREHFAEVLFKHEGRASNAHAHDLAHSSLYLLLGRRLWLLQSPDQSIVPMVINE